MYKFHIASNRQAAIIFLVVFFGLFAAHLMGWLP